MRKCSKSAKLIILFVSWETATNTSMAEWLCVALELEKSSLNPVVEVFLWWFKAGRFHSRWRWLYITTVHYLWCAMKSNPEDLRMNWFILEGFVSSDYGGTADLRWRRPQRPSYEDFVLLFAILYLLIYCKSHIPQHVMINHPIYNSTKQLNSYKVVKYSEVIHSEMKKWKLCLYQDSNGDCQDNKNVPDLTSL